MKIMEKIKEINDNASSEGIHFSLFIMISSFFSSSLTFLDKMDIGIVVEDKEKPEYTVQVLSGNVLVNELREEVNKQCEDITFHYKFINLTTR